MLRTIKALQITLIILVTLSGCAKKAEISTAITNTGTITKSITDSINYLALGDSYTVGQSVNPDESYPAQLVDALNIKAFPTKMPTIIATTGWTSEALIQAIANSTITNNKYDIVTLLIGVNDQYEELSEDAYRTNFIQLLHTATKFAQNDSTRVFVLSIPDYGVTPFASGRDSIIGPEIDQFNAINKAESFKAGVNYLDITAISKLAANNPALIAPDGLHPSGDMYALWVAQLAPMVEARLKK